MDIVRETAEHASGSRLEAGPGWLVSRSPLIEGQPALCSVLAVHHLAVSIRGSIFRRTNRGQELRGCGTALDERDSTPRFGQSRNSWLVFGHVCQRISERRLP